MFKDLTWKTDPEGKYRPFTWVKVGDDAIMTLSQAGPIPNEIFTDYIVDLRDLKGKRLLGTAVGSIDVTATQRKEAAEVMKGWPMSIVTDSAVARGVATAMKWLGLDIEGFSWKNVEDALRRLDIPSRSVPELLEVLEELLRRSGGRKLHELR